MIAIIPAMAAITNAVNSEATSWRRATDWTSSQPIPLSLSRIWMLFIAITPIASIVSRRLKRLQVAETRRTFVLRIAYGMLARGFASQLIGVVRRRIRRVAEHLRGPATL